MLNLAEYAERPRLLADYLPWACLVAPGVIRYTSDMSALRFGEDRVVHVSTPASGPVEDALDVVRVFCPQAGDVACVGMRQARMARAEAGQIRLPQGFGGGQHRRLRRRTVTG